MLFLDHVQYAMPVGKEDVAREFFVAILGMYEVDKPEPLKSRGGCWFEYRDVIVHVGVERDFVPSRKAHAGFVVENIDSVASRLESAGYDVLWDDEYLERPRFYTHDPFGNRMEFIKKGFGFQEIETPRVKE